MKNIVSVAVVIAACALLFVQQRKISQLRAEYANAAAALADARQENKSAAQTPVRDPKEEERLNQERAELAKLRAEVSALRKEKAAWQKGGTQKSSPALSDIEVPAAPPAVTPAAQGMQWVETILNGPPQLKGTESGNVRRKLLNGEPLTEAEQALLMNMNSKTADIEKSPEEFSNFQSAYIASLLGWTTDARLEVIKGVLNAAATAATSKGFDYHAPGENAAKWTDEQVQLNSRATSAIQNLLKPEERAMFDKALIGVLGIDTGTGPAQK